MWKMKNENEYVKHITHTRPRPSYITFKRDGTWHVSDHRIENADSFSLTFDRARLYALSYLNVIVSMYFESVTVS